MSKSFDKLAESMKINFDGSKNRSWKKFGGSWFKRDNFQYRRDRIDYEKRKAREAGFKVRTVKDGKWFSLFTRPKK